MGLFLRCAELIELVIGDVVIGRGNVVVAAAQVGIAQEVAGVIVAIFIRF